MPLFVYEMTLSREEVFSVLNTFRKEAESVFSFWPVNQPAIYKSMRMLTLHSLKSHDAI